ncbi:MAG TPA: choice-of-anchor D domain-containing protein, partial [Candidatus Kapabacteria bacterium]|nr:choice-of-anchor D domain-containing protein [Candidatus Kapabacteria bacterium]
GIILASNGGVIVTGPVDALKGKGSAGSNGGSNGGDGSDGRIRIDYLNSVGNSISPAVGYSGPTLDTVPRTKSYGITFQGTASDNKNSQINIYVQRMDGSYQQNGAPYTTTVNNSRFQQTIALDSASGSLFFFVTAIKTDGTTNVMSDAGALILPYTVCPSATPSSLNFTTASSCSPPQGPMIDTINPGSDTVTLTLAKGSTAIFNGFPNILSSGATYYEKISFTPTVPGIYNDTLIIHDVNSSSSCPDIRIPLFGIYDSIHLANSANIINFGTLRLGQPGKIYDTITNLSKTVPVTITGVHWDPPDTRISVVATFGRTLQTAPPSDTMSLELDFLGTVPADSIPYNGQLVIEYTDSLCPSDSVMIPMQARMIVPYITVSTDTLNFGENASCHDSVMTVTFYNRGNATYHIQSVQMDSAAVKKAFVLVSPATSDSILQGDSIRYTIRFHPLSPDGIKTSVLELVSNDRPNGLIQIVLIGDRISSSYSVTPPSVSLGTVNVGSSHWDTVIVRDTGATNICVSNVSIAAPFSLSGTLQKTLLPNDTMQIIVSFTPGVNDTAKFTGTLKIATDCPCSDTALVTVQAAGSIGVPNYSPGSLNFGTLLKCFTKTDSVKIWNDGNAPISLDSIHIAGTDGPLFSIIQGPANGHTLNPGDTVYVVITYNGITTGGDGPKAASLLLYTTFNGKQTVLTISLNAVRISASATSTANNIRFNPAVLVSQFATQIDTVINSGTTPLKILGVQTAPANDFSATANPAPPTTLGVGDTMFVTIKFAPDSTNSDSTKIISALLEIAFDDTCRNGADTVNVPLFGRGYKTGPSPVILCLGADTSAAIGSTIFLPITIDTSLSIFDSLSITMYIRYDPMVLRVLGASSQCGSATVTANPKTKIITLTIPKCMNVVQRGVIATLEAEVLIGPHNTATLSIDSAAYSSPYIQYAGCPSVFVLTVDTNCSFGLIGTSGTNALAQNYPNPVTSNGQMVTITYETVADTHVLLRVFDIYGREVARLVDGDVPHGKYVVGFDAHNLPNGTYYYTIDAGLFHAARHLVVLR